MLAFKGPPPEGHEVCHNNGDPADNRLENLRYGTRTDNLHDLYLHGEGRSKLAVDDIRSIRESLITGIPGSHLARAYHVSETTISRIKTGRTFSWLQ